MADPVQSGDLRQVVSGRDKPAVLCAQEDMPGQADFGSSVRKQTCDAGAPFTHIASLPAANLASIRFTQGTRSRCAPNPSCKTNCFQLRLKQRDYEIILLGWLSVDRQPDLKARRSGRGIKRNLAAVLADDATGGVKAQANAVADTLG